jgi:hypothetical protein
MDKGAEVRSGEGRRRRHPVKPARLSSLSAVLISLLVACGPPSGRPPLETEGPAVPAPPAGQGLEWATNADAPTPRTEAVGAAAGDRIVIVGGLTEEGATDRVEIYDAAGDSWREGPPLPLALHHAMAASIEERVFVFGGYQGGGFDSVSRRAFVLEGEAWREITPMPETRAAGGAAAAAGRIFVVGGVSPERGSLASTTLVLDPASERWSFASGLPTPREHLGVTSHDGMVYAVGGRTGGIGSNLGAFESLDPGTGTWTSLPDLPTPRGGMAAAAGSGLIVAAGGEEQAGTFPEVEAFDLRSGSWGALPPLPTPRHGLAVVALGPVVYAITGGPQPGGTYSASNESIDLSGLSP